MRSVLLLLSLLVAGGASAHEFWIEPVDARPSADGMVVADLVNGQDFDGTRLPYIPARTEALTLTFDGETTDLAPRIGDRPAVNVPALGDGLHVAAYVSTWSPLTYDDFAVFRRFAAHKDLLGGEEATVAAHLARGFSEADGPTESYARYSKALIGVGSAAGSDVELGLETELVALDNPYTDDVSDGVRVALTYKGEPRGDEQVEIYDRPPEGEVEVSTVRTDAEGVAVVPVEPGHVYMLDAVVLREPEAAPGIESGAMWESLWANLVFAVPE